MYPFSFNVQKHKHKRAPAGGFEVRYLAAHFEPKEVAAAGRGAFGARTRYLAMHQMRRTIHRLRRSLV